MTYEIQKTRTCGRMVPFAPDDSYRVAVTAPGCREASVNKQHTCNAEPGSRWIARLLADTSGERNGLIVDRCLVNSSGLVWAGFPVIRGYRSLLVLDTTVPAVSERSAPIRNADCLLAWRNRYSREGSGSTTKKIW